TVLSDGDLERAAIVERLCGPEPKRVLEIGSGFGGTAAALANQGHLVTAVELSSVRAEYARELALEKRKGQLKIVEADFYQVELMDQFDLVCYWNGFGTGTDADQRRLLRKIASTWLMPNGCLLMNIFSPWWWVRQAGTTESKPPN